MEQKTKDTLTAAAIGAGVVGVIGAAVAGIDGMDIDAIESMIDSDSKDFTSKALASDPNSFAESLQSVDSKTLAENGIRIEPAPAETPGVIESFFDRFFAEEVPASIAPVDKFTIFENGMPVKELTPDELTSLQDSLKAKPEALEQLKNSLVNSSVGETPSTDVSSASSPVNNTDYKDALSKVGADVTSDYKDMKPFKLESGETLWANLNGLETGGSEKIADAVNNARDNVSAGKSTGIGAVAGAGAGAFLSMKNEPSHADRVRPNGPQGADWSQVMQQQQAMLQNAYANRG